MYGVGGRGSGGGGGGGRRCGCVGVSVYNVKCFKQPRRFTESSDLVSL